MKHGGAIYGIGMLGALVYFMQHANSFWSVVTGVLKSFFWPGVFVYKVLEMWQM
jgi:hypothetical protein